MTKLRVLHTLSRIYSGGVEQRRLLMLRGLSSARYEHLFVCQEANGELPQLIRSEGAEVVEIGPARHILDLAWHDRALAIARDFRPDIVHGAVFEGVALGNSIGLRLPEVPVISEETSDPANRSWRGDLLFRAMCMRSKVVIGVSPAVGMYLKQRARIPVKKIRVINNAISPPPHVSEHRISELRAALGLSADDVIVGSVGRVVDEHKRFSDLIRAFSLRPLSNPKLKLLIVGDGPDLEGLKSLASDLGVSDRVCFCGYQGAARDFYSLMHVFALASAHEAFGLVLVEAMMANLPVVATAVGGIPFVLDEGNCGRLVPPLRPDALAGAIEELLRDEAQRRRLARAGRSRADKHFSAERYCIEIDQLYQTLRQ